MPFVVDAAQSCRPPAAWTWGKPIGIDLLAAPGHKALLGPLGTGFLYIRPGLEKRMLRPLREGGTGSQQRRGRSPAGRPCPTSYEPGSHNAVGLAGLLAGVKWVRQQTVEKLQDHERGLIQTFLDATGNIDGLTLHGPPGVADRLGVFSVRCEGLEPQELSAALETGYGVLTRSGIHCAPFAHRALGTTDGGGATRLSVGPFVTRPDVRYAADALSQVAAGMAVA